MALRRARARKMEEEECAEGGRRQENVSGEGLELPAAKPQGARKRSSAPRRATARASARIRAKALSARKAPKAEQQQEEEQEEEEEEEEDAQGGPEASDTVQTAKAGGEAEQDGQEGPPRAEAHSPRPCQPLPLQPLPDLPETAGLTAQPRPADGAREPPSQPQRPLEGDSEQSLPSASQQLSGSGGSREPAPKRARLTPEATFTPTAAGLRPRETQEEPEIPPGMRPAAPEAVAPDVAPSIEQTPQAASSAPDDPLQQGQPPAIPRDLPVSHRSHSPNPSAHSREPFSEEEDKELLLSEEEGVAPYPPDSTGLFRPALFKSLLCKAKATAGIGADPAASDPALGVSDPNASIFSEPAANKEDIPCPKYFLDIVQRQWIQPGSSTVPSLCEKRFYNVAANLTAALETPTIDGALATLTASTVMSNDPGDALTAQEKRAEQTLCKAHKAAAWVVKAATAASFFNRTSLVWLKELQARIPAIDVRTHQDINKLVAATEFSADATLNSAKFASRAMASSVTSRRLLWLRHWKANMKCKWKLASAPFKGDKLFGEALEPILTETKDKKKILPSTSKRPVQRSSPYFQKPSFRATDTTHNFSQGQWPYFQQRNLQSSRPSYRGKTRQQFQSKRPLRGNGGLQTQPSDSWPSKKRNETVPHGSCNPVPVGHSSRPASSRGTAATGVVPHSVCSPEGFGGEESDSRPKKTQQKSGIQKLQNAAPTGQHLGGRLPDINRSHTSLPTHPSIARSSTVRKVLLPTPTLPVQGPPIRPTLSSKDIHEDPSGALGSPQNHPYSSPSQYFQQRHHQSDRPGYREEIKQQFQTKRPFRGNGSPAIRHSSRELQTQPSDSWPSTKRNEKIPHGSCNPAPVGHSSRSASSRGTAETGVLPHSVSRPKDFGGEESDSRPKKTQQESGIKKLQNAVHTVQTGQHPGGRLPDVDRSHGSIPRHPSTARSQTIPKVLLHKPTLPVQGPPIRPILSSKDIHEDRRSALGSPQNPPYSSPSQSRRDTDPIHHSQPGHGGPPLCNLDPSVSRILRELREELLLLDDTPPMRTMIQDIIHRLPVPGPPGQHHSSGEPDPRGSISAPGPPHSTLKQGGIQDRHRSLDMFACQTLAEEKQKEQFNYKSPGRTRSPPDIPVVDGPRYSQEMSIQGDEPSQRHHGRQSVRNLSNAELNPRGPISTPGPHTTLKQDSVLHRHRPLGTFVRQTLAGEKRQEQFNYQSPGRTRSPPDIPMVDVPHQSQGMPIQGSDSSQCHRRRQSRWGSPLRDTDERRPVVTGSFAKQHQVARGQGRSPSPPMDPERHLQSPRGHPNRQRSHQDPYQPSRADPLEFPHVGSRALGTVSGRTSSIPADRSYRGNIQYTGRLAQPSHSPPRRMSPASRPVQDTDRKFRVSSPGPVHHSMRRSYSWLPTGREGRRSPI